MSETTGSCDENERVCNIFQLQLHRLFLLPTTFVNAPRRATEATEGTTAPKYCKIGEKGLFPAFSTGNAETSDFFDTKFRCFALKVRMFVPKKSDVFNLPAAFFMPFFVILGLKPGILGQPTRNLRSGETFCLIY